MRTAIIVQARFGSNRLPGKALLPLGSGTVLSQVLARCALIPGADVVVCATPDTPDSDPVAAEGARCGALVVRGGEHDVLSRYAKAARAARADIVMRVTSDCPFIDPLICGKTLELLHASGAAYASLDMPVTWPHGLDCEAFPASWLFRADAEAKEPYDREHVTPWIRARAKPKATLTGPGAPFTHMRWTLDWPEDYAFAQGVCAALGARAALAPASEIASLCLRRPDIAGLNAARLDEARLASPLRSELASPAIGFPLAA
jgi:spore coat polysaccharide biosynthesis protein SpsF (cytidylyltransferase family)